MDVLQIKIKIYYFLAHFEAFFAIDFSHNLLIISKIKSEQVYSAFPIY